MNEFIRKLDGLGRIVLPKEFRKSLKINNDSKLKITEEDNFIKIEKYSDINNNIENLFKLKNIIKKELNIDILITDLDNIIEKNINISKEILKIIKYGKIEILNNNKDILLNNDKNINLIVIPIILYGEIIGSVIGYSYNKEIDSIDKKILEIAISILIKDIEE